MTISNTVANSSNVAIVDGFERIVRNYIPNERWIGKRNYYAHDTVKKTDNTQNIGQVKEKQLTEYIAASTVLHCYDGWNFISRAVESLINNDVSSAIHYIYYAELRAVMSFMANEGIGIFNNKHFWFDMNSRCAFVEVQQNNYRIGTHGLAEKCLTEWSNLQSKKDNLFKLIRIKNHRLSQWINSTNFTTGNGYSSEIVGKWLSDWSVDLKLSMDQDLRNEMSYRPHFNLNYLNVKDTVDKLNQIWQAIEPTESSRFSELDLHLSRIALERVFINSTGKPLNGRFRGRYISFLNNTFDNIGESRTQVLYEFLLRNRDPQDHFIIQQAKKDKNNNSINLSDPFPMLCRAILLLRLSSGCVFELFENSTLNKKDLRYWWEDICLNKGIIAIKNDEQFPADLYTDIKDSFTTILERSTSESWSSVRNTSINYADEFNIIKQFQRVCFWGIGL